MRITAWSGLSWGCAALLSLAANAETITVAAEDDWAPYSYATADDTKPAGMAPQLVTAAFKTQGIDVRFVVVPFSRCLHYTRQAVVVACFDVSITTENRHQFIWHPTPMFTEELGIFGRADSPASQLKVQDLEGRTVGITNGYTYATELMDNPRIRKVTAPSDSNLLKMLVAGRVDYVLLNTTPGLWRINQDPLLKRQVKRVGAVSQDGFWLSFSSRHPDGQRLANTFEKGLQAIKASGEYTRLMSAMKARVGM